MMNMNIKGLQIDLTDAIKEYVQTRVAPAGQLAGKDAYLYARVGKASRHHRGGSEEFIAELTLDTHGHLYFVETKMADLYAAIDAAAEELVSQIREGRGKRQTLVRKGRLMLKNLLRRTP